MFILWPDSVFNVVRSYDWNWDIRRICHFSITYMSWTRTITIRYERFIIKIYSKRECHAHMDRDMIYFSERLHVSLLIHITEWRNHPVSRLIANRHCMSCNKDTHTHAHCTVTHGRSSHAIHKNDEWKKIATGIIKCIWDWTWCGWWLHTLLRCI